MGIPTEVPAGLEQSPTSVEPSCGICRRKLGVTIPHRITGSSFCFRKEKRERKKTKTKKQKQQITLCWIERSSGTCSPHQTQGVCFSVCSEGTRVVLFSTCCVVQGAFLASVVVHFGAGNMREERLLWRRGPSKG